MSLRSVIFLLIACLAAAQPVTASTLTHFPGWTSYDVDFSAFPVATPTPFSETIGDLNVVYTAPDDPFAFATVNSQDIPASPWPFPLLLGGAGSLTLGIRFTEPVFGILAEFVTVGPGPIQMDLLSGGLSGIVVGSRSESGVIPPGLIYPEGFISMLPVCICPNYFDAVRLSSDSRFAIRRMLVTQSLPEPTTLAMFSIGLVLLAALRFARLQRTYYKTSETVSGRTG
jgi:hypothetical protein